MRALFVRRLLLKSSAVVSCGALMATGAASSPPDEVAKVDAYVRSEMQRERIPGLALGVYRDGKIIKAEGYGIANLEWDAPVKPDTIFQSGSVGKQFAATAVMMLVEEGKVGLDDPVQKYFPDAPETWKDIKIRNLLSHTSGLSEYENGPRTKPDGPFYLRLDMTEDEMYKRIAAMPMDFKPGEDWSYRNTNYVLLGILIHKVTGKFYGDYLQERIFKPLGMTSTRIISDRDIIRHRASGYELDRRPTEESGLGFSYVQFHRGWHPLFHRPGLGKMGRRSLHRKIAEEIEFRSDVDCNEAQQRSA